MSIGKVSFTERYVPIARIRLSILVLKVVYAFSLTMFSIYLTYHNLSGKNEPIQLHQKRKVGKRECPVQIVFPVKIITGPW